MPSAKSIDILLNAKDQATPGIASMTASLAQLKNQMGSMQQQITGLSDQFKSIFDTIKDGLPSLKMEGVGAGVGDVSDKVKGLAGNLGEAYEKGKKLFEALKGGGVARLGAIGAIGAAAYEGGRMYVDDVERSTADLEGSDKSVGDRHHRYGANETREGLDAKLKANADALKAAQEKDNGYRDNPLYNNRLFENQAKSAAQEVATLEMERNQLQAQSRRFDATGRVTEAVEETPGGIFNKGAAAFGRGLLGRAKIDLDPLNDMGANLRGKLGDFRQNIRPFEKEADAAAEIRKQNRTPEEVYADTVKELGANKFLGKKGLERATRAAKLKLASDLGIEPDEAKQRGPTRFSVTESRLLNTGQGFEDPGVAIQKQQLDQQQKQAAILEKVQAVLEKIEANKGKVLKAG